MGLRLTSEKAVDRLCVALGALISCYFAFYNQFPLVYEDTGTYIFSGFKGEVPIDRPLLYGLFLRHISLSDSLWYVVYAQAFILSYLLFNTTSVFFSGTRKRIVFLTLIVLLTTFTGYSYYVSLLIPDIFAAAFFLAVFNLMFLPQQSIRGKLITAGIVVFCTGTQFSLRVVFVLLLVAMLGIALYNRRQKGQWLPILRSTTTLTTLLVLSVILTWAIGRVYKNPHKQVNASYIFVLNHLNEVGILKEHLAATCEEKQYKLCQYRDSIPWDFMWDERSPLYRLGGWSANNDEYGKVVWDVCTNIKYLKVLVQRSLEHTIAQCFVFNVEPSAPQTDKTQMLIQIDWRFPEQVRDYLNDRQSNKRLNVNFLNTMQGVAILFSVLVLFIILSSQKLAGKLPNIRLQVILLLVFCVGNAWICSTFSTVIHRFQGRIVWLLPVLAFLYVAKLVSDKFFQSAVGEIAVPNSRIETEEEN